MGDWNLLQEPVRPGRVAVVTGANSGLGFAAALELARKQYRVVMACRDPYRADRAREELLSQCRRADLHVMELDLARQASVHAFAASFSEERLDLLINNAGVMMTPYRRTEDDFEQQLAVNYLGHFALTGLLLPRLTATQDARVVTLTSLSYKWSPLRFSDPHFTEGYSRLRAYGQSKRACLVFSYELQRRLTAASTTTRSVAAHPGLVATELDRHFPQILRHLGSLFLQPVERGVQPILYAALSDAVRGGDFVGPDGWLGVRGNPTRVSSDAASRKPDVGRRWWALSEQLTGVRYLLILMCVLAGSLTAAAQQATGQLAGYVRDGKSGEGLIGATVQLENTELGTTTDLDGYYEFRAVPPKTYNVTASYLGYQPATQFNVIVRSAGTPELNFELTEASATLDEVVVRGTATRDIISPLSAQTLSAVEIATYPGGNNDLAKVIQSLPGVAGSVGGFRNDVIIRGGAPNENVYYLDGVEIPNINHFATQGSAGGPIGLLNVSFIEDVDLATSAFDARYDNALSGVLQFNQREGSRRDFKGNVRISSSEAALTLEGPLGPKTDESARTSYLVSGRRSYLQLLFDLIGLPILPDYWDYQYKITHDFDDYNSLTLLGVGSIDDLTVNDIEEFDPEQQAAQEQVPVIRQWSTTAGLSYRRRFRSGAGSFRSTLSTNVLDNAFTRYRNNIAETGVLFRNDSRESEIKWRNQLTNYLGEWIVSSGFSVQRADYRNATENVIDTLSFDAAIDFYRYGAFLQLARSLLGGRLNVSAGLRTDANTYTSPSRQLLRTLSPRAGISYALDRANRWRLSGSVGVYYKLPPFTVLGFRDGGGQPVNRAAEYIRSTHYVAGLEYKPRPSLTVSLEGFYKRYADYPVSVLDSVSLANKGAGFEVLGNEAVQPVGEGRTYGLELLLQQQFTGRFYGILAYTLCKSEFTGFDGRFRPSAWDSRHLLTFTGGYKLGDNWEVSLRYRFVGPTPYAPVDPAATLPVYPALVLDFDRLGEVTLDAFNQADLRVDRKWNFSNVSLNVFFEVQNLLAQQAPEPPTFGLDRGDDGAVLDPRRLITVPINNGEVLPTLGIVFDF